MDNSTCQTTSQVVIGISASTVTNAIAGTVTGAPTQALKTHAIQLLPDDTSVVQSVYLMFRSRLLESMAEVTLAVLLGKGTRE
jgi:flavoprotein